MPQDLFSAEGARSPSGNGTGTNNNSPGIRLSGITLQDLARLMSVGTRSGHRITVVPDYEDENDGDDDGDIEYMDEDDEPPIRTNQWIPPHKEPQKAGLDLLASGEFGSVDIKNRARRDRPSRTISRRILNQFTHPVPVHSREAVQAVGIALFLIYVSPHPTLFQHLVPNTNGVTVASYESNMYTAQFSDGKVSILDNDNLLIFQQRCIILLYMCTR